MNRDRQDREGRKALPLTFFLSLLLHAILAPLFALLFLNTVNKIIASQPPAHAAPLIIEQRQRPAIRPNFPFVTKPRRIVQPQAQPQPPTQPQPEHVAHEAPHTRPQPRELAKLVPHAPAQQQAARPTLAQTLAEQERTFAREAQQLHAQENPLAVPTNGTMTNGYHGNTLKALAQYENPEEYFAYLYPLQHWFDGDRSCYYVSYIMQSSQGGSENGNIPWPICYPRNADRMLPLNRTHWLPVPVPPPEYVLPSGTYLTPFLRGIYEQRSG